MQSYRENNLYESARLKTLILQEHISKNIIINKTVYENIQEELSLSKNLIEKLKYDKKKLKKALADSISKRNSIYSQYIHYKKLSESIQVPSPRLESVYKLEKNAEIGSVKQQIHTRNKKIQELYSEIENIEELLMKKDVESNTWKELYNASKYIDKESQIIASSNFSDKVYESYLKVLKKIKVDKALYEVFKQASNCSNYFISLLKHNLYDEALLKFLNFFELVLRKFKIKSLYQRTPSFSPHLHIKNNDKYPDSYSPQVSILVSENSLSKDKNEKKKSLRIPRISRINKNQSPNELEEYL